MAVHGNDSSVAADVAELVVVWPEDDFATEAAHETGTWHLWSGSGVVVRVVMVVLGARRGG